MNPLSKRRLGALTAAALVATAVTAVAAPALATSPTTPLSQGAAWVAAQIDPTSHLVHNSQYDFDDIGGTIYAVDALKAANPSADVSASVTAVGANLVGSNGYIEADEYAFSPPYAFVQHGYYANAAANALVFAESVGQTPTNYNGVDLVAKTEARIATTTGATGGQIADDSSYGNYANTIGQALAAHGLAVAGSSDAASALAFLVKQQCSAGYFRLYAYAGSDSSWTCDAGNPTTESAADVDVTALVAHQLAPMAGTSVIAARALGRAESWLLTQQHTDGSFGGGPSTPLPNANSTGLAGTALGETGHVVAASNAAAWLRAHQAQNLAPCSDQLDAQAGAIAYNSADLAAARTQGITTDKQSYWRLATFQALPALQYYSPAAASSALKATAATTYLRAKTHTNVTVSGLVAGAPACVTLGTGHVSVAAGLGGSAVASVLLPAGTANRSVSVTDGTTTTSVTVKVLDAKTFTLSPSTLKPRRGTSFTLRVSGLAKSERVTVSYAGRVVLRGTASSTGTYAHTIAAGSSLGNKALVVVGQFSNRKGAKTITVVR